MATARGGEAARRRTVSASAARRGDASGEFHVEDLVGRPVLDRDGRKMGRVSEIRVERIDGALVVTGVLIGAWGWVERLAMQKVWRHGRGWLARWDQIDFADFAHPRLVVPRSALVLEPPRRGVVLRGGDRAGG